MGKRETEARQCLETEEFTLSIQMTKSTKNFSRSRGENWKGPWHQPCHAKDNEHHESGCKAENRIREECQNNEKLHNGISRIHETTSRLFAVQKPGRSHCRSRIYIDVSLQFGAQVHPDAISNENTGCKGRSG